MNSAWTFQNSAVTIYSAFEEAFQFATVHAASTYFNQSYAKFAGCKSFLAPNPTDSAPGGGSWEVSDGSITIPHAEKCGYIEKLTKYGTVLSEVGSKDAAHIIPPYKWIEQMSAESWERIISVNLTGTFHCVQAVIGDMTDAGWGRVVLISSSSAQRGASGMTHYAASKGGVIAFGKSLALEFAARGATFTLERIFRRYGMWNDRVAALYAREGGAGAALVASSSVSEPSLPTRPPNGS